MRKTMKNQWLKVLMLGIFGLAAAGGAMLFAWPSPASALDTTVTTTHTTVTVTQKCKGDWGRGFIDSNLGWSDGGFLIPPLIILPDCSNTTVATAGIHVPDNADGVVIFTFSRNNNVSADCSFINAYDGSKVKNECKAKGETGAGKNKQKLEIKNAIEIK